AEEQWDHEGSSWLFVLCLFWSVGQEQFGQPKVVGRRDLEIGLVARHEPRVLADEFEKLKVVGHLFERDRSAVERVEEEIAADDLRRLQCPELIARDRLLYRR